MFLGLSFALALFNFPGNVLHEANENKVKLCCVRSMPAHFENGENVTVADSTKHSRDTGIISKNERNLTVTNSLLSSQELDTKEMYPYLKNL